MNPMLLMLLEIIQEQNNSFTIRLKFTRKKKITQRNGISFRRLNNENSRGIKKKIYRENVELITFSKVFKDSVIRTLILYLLFFFLSLLAW